MITDKILSKMGEGNTPKTMSHPFRTPSSGSLRHLASLHRNLWARPGVLGPQAQGQCLQHSIAKWCEASTVNPSRN